MRFSGGNLSRTMQTSHNLAYKSLQNARLLSVLCVFWKIRTVSVEIGRIDLAEPCLPTLDRMFGKNIQKQFFVQAEIKSHVNSPLDARFTSSQTFI